MNCHNEGRVGPPSFWSSRYAIGLIVIGVVAAYFLLTEHLAHAVGALPYLLFLVCPLMHIFMHRGHAGHGLHHEQSKSDAPTNSNPQKPGDPS